MFFTSVSVAPTLHVGLILNINCAPQCRNHLIFREEFSLNSCRYMSYCHPKNTQRFMLHGVADILHPQFYTIFDFADVP